MGIRILVVDDSSLMRHVIKKVLQQTNIQIDEVLEACDGKEAIEIVLRQPVDLVLSDINMPRMDGIEMLTQLRQIESKQTLPVILVTTEGTEGAIQQAMDLGATAYVLKPFTPEILADNLRRAGVIAECPKTETQVDFSDPNAF